MPHRAEVLDRDQPGGGLVVDAQLWRRSEPSERLAGHLHLELRVTAALVGATQHRHVGVVASHAKLDVPPRARRPERRVDTEPAVGRDVRLGPGVRGARNLDAAEVAADVAGRQTRVPAERDQHVREVLTDAGSPREHLGHGALHSRGTDPELEPCAHVIGGACEKGESARLRILGEDRLGDGGRLVREGDVGTRAEELREVVRKRLVTRELPDRGRRVGLALGRACERLVDLRVGDHVARRLDHEAVVQVRDAEVVHGVAVVVPKRDTVAGGSIRRSKSSRVCCPPASGCSRTSLKLSKTSLA